MRFKHYRSLNWRAGSGTVSLTDAQRAIFRVRLEFFKDTGFSMPYEHAEAYVTLFQHDEDKARQYFNDLKAVTISFPPIVKNVTEK